MKTIAVIGDELGLSVFHVDIPQAFVQAPLEEMCNRLPLWSGKLSDEIVKLLNVSMD